jgi:hypothetical protein
MQNEENEKRRKKISKIESDEEDGLKKTGAFKPLTSLHVQTGAGTPKHGSWLNIAEIELNVLARQCFCQMIGNVLTLRQQVAAWEAQ